MRIPSVKELISSNNYVKFNRYQKGELWYQVWAKMPYVNSEENRLTGEFEQVNTGFEFPVPIDDTGDGVFMVEDKALLFMRYIRKHIDYLKSASN